MQQPLSICILLVFSGILFADNSIKTNAIAPQYPAESEPIQNEPEAMDALCQSYAQDEKISTNQQQAYIQDCITSMTEMNTLLNAPIEDSENASNEHTETASADHAQAETPESLITNEIVTTPNPKAEQLDTN